MPKPRFSIIWILGPIGLAAILLGSAAADDAAPGKDAATPQEKSQRAAKLVEQLGDADFKLRERAQADLAEMGFDAYDVLTAATRHEDLEVASRARYLLRLMRVQWTFPSDPPEVKRILESYENESAENRVRKIRDLAKLSGVKGAEALCRLVRYEQSPMLGKLAAVELINRDPVAAADRQKLREVLKAQLSGCSRTPAKWLVLYVELSAGPPASPLAWAQLADEEQAAMRRTPEHSSPQIVVSLLYQLAVFQVAQGKADIAEQTADRARRIAADRTPIDLFGHLETAYMLRRRGLFPWSEGEFRVVIESKVPEVAAAAGISLAEMRHDQGRHEAAADALRAVLRMVDEKLLENLNIGGRTAGETRARLNYFLACHWAAQGDLAKQKAHLDEAIKTFPQEIDVLIARYRLTGQDEEYRKATAKLVEKAAAGLREEMLATNDDPNAYNQYAWLVGNTGGDLDDALRCAQRAVELEPDNGAYRDTLAHVYFARRDFARAVTEQRLAADMEPHSGQIMAELAAFEKAAKEQGK